MSVVVFNPDYAKWSLPVPQDLWESYWTLFQGQWSRSNPGIAFEKTGKVTVLNAAQNRPKLYIIEVWGEASKIVRDFTAPVWFDRLTRLDMKAQVYGVTRQGNYELGMELGRADGHLGVDAFNRPPRTKRNGRDAGGKGFRVGSKKADLCITSYARPSSHVGLEFQCKDTMLKRLIKKVNDRWQNNANNAAKIDFLFEEIAPIAYARLSQKFVQAELAERLALYLPDSEYAPILHNVVSKVVKAPSLPSEENDDSHTAQARFLDV
jgi:hypothetical protein